MMSIDNPADFESRLLSEFFMEGPAKDWSAVTRRMLIDADSFIAMQAIAPTLLQGTSGAYLNIFRARLVQLVAMIDQEAERRDAEPGGPHPVRDADMSEALDAHSANTRAVVAERTLTWLAGENPNEDKPQEPQPEGS